MNKKKRKNYKQQCKKFLSQFELCTMIGMVVTSLFLLFPIFLASLEKSALLPTVLLAYLNRCGDATWRKRLPL